MSQGTIAPPTPTAAVSGPAQGRPILGQITSLRFLAALSIVFHHYGSDLLGHGPFLDRILRAMGSGVSFFFVLSGFVLVYAYDSPVGIRSIRSFYVARFARIYPVYFLGLLAVVLMAVAEVLVWKDSGNLRTVLVPAALSLFAIQAWFPPFANGANPPAWSLSAEAFFYLLFPLFLRPGFRRFLGTRGGLVLLLLVLSTGTVPLVPLHIVYPHAESALEGTREFAMRNWAYFWPLFRLPEFLLGVAVGSEFVKPDRRRLPEWTWIAALVAVVLLMAGIPASSQVFLHNSLLAPLFALGIYGLASSEGKAARICSARWAVLLGESSYSLYILHVPVFVWLQVAARKLGLLRGPANFCLYLVMAVGISVLVFRRIESPLRTWIRNRMCRAQGVAA